MKKSILILISSATLVMPIVGHAQFGGIGNMLSGSKNSGGAATDLVGQQDLLSRNYVNAGKDVLKANDRFADALGIKAQAVNASTTSDSLSASDIESQDKAISAEAKALSDALKSGATLKDTEAKVKYGQGLISLVSGVKKYIGMRTDAQNFSSSLSSASPLQLPKLQAGAYIVKSLPTSVTNLTNVLKSAIDFGRSNGVEIPADATSLL